MSFVKLCEPEKVEMPAGGSELPHSLLCAQQGVCVLEATELITDERPPGIITTSGTDSCPLCSLVRDCCVWNAGEGDEG